MVNIYVNTLSNLIKHTFFHTDMLQWVKSFLDAMSVKPIMFLTTDKSLPRLQLLRNHRGRRSRMMGVDGSGRFRAIVAVYTFMDGAHGQLPERVHSFLFSALHGTTADRYQASVDTFNSDRGLDLSSMTEEDLDYALADEVVQMWEDGGVTCVGISLASVLLAAMSKTFPRYSLKTAWRCLDVWHARALPKRQLLFRQPCLLYMDSACWPTGCCHGSAAVFHRFASRQ
jgi:hypothetical protein